MTAVGTVWTRRALALSAIAIALLLAWNAAANAAPPANDAFADAVALPDFPTEESGSNQDATKELGEPYHAGNPGGHSVWFKWTPSSSRVVGIRSGNCFDGIDPLIAVYTGSSVDGLTPVASNQSSFPPTCFFAELPQAEFEATAGTTYWIAVDGRNGAQGSFNLRFSGAPENDDFAEALVLGPEPSQDVFSTTRLATKETDEPDHAGDPGGYSVWFEWTPTASEPVRIATCTNSSSLDGVVAVYTGTQLDSLTEVAANDETQSPFGFGGCIGPDGAVTVNAVAGTTYWIAVDGANGTSGKFNLRIEGRPVNDDFASAQELVPWPGGSAVFANGGNEFATKESGEPDHAGVSGGHSVWFSWTAQDDGRVRIVTCSTEGGDLDTVLGVYTGSSVDNLTQVGSNDDGPRSRCPRGTSEVDLSVTAGTTYKIAVDGKGGTQGRFGLSIEGPAAHDAFAEALELPSSDSISIGHSNFMASKEAGEPNHAANTGGHSVWFSWTAPSSGPVAISTCPYMEESPDTLLAVYKGSSIGSLTPVTASDDSPSACQEAGSEVQFDAVGGTTYRIAVDSKGIDEGYFNFELSGPPANDDFGSAQVLNSSPFFGGSTQFAGKESGEPNHAGDPGGHSVWYSWTAAESGPVGVYACGRKPGVDTLLAVYTGSGVTGLTSVAANDDVANIPQNEICEPDSGGSDVVFQATAGTTYRIAVDTKDSEGRFYLGLEEAPQNDDLADAKDLFGGLPTSGLAFSKLADKEGGEPNHAGSSGGHSVWFRWTAQATGSVVFQTCTFDPGFDTLLAVYTGADVGSLTPVASGDDGQGRRGCRSTDSVAELTATAGTTYLIAVDGKGGSSGNVQLIGEGVQVNDDFGKAQPLGGNLPAQAEGSNLFAGAQTGEPDHAGGPASSSVWFKWTAPRSGTVSVDTCDSDFDSRLAVYTGATLGSLTPVQSNDDGSGSCAPGSHLSFAAVANTTYRIAVDGSAGGQGTFGLHLEERAENDDFEEAAVIPGRPGWYWPGSTMLADKETGEPDHGGDAGGHSVWFSWTPRKSWMVEVDVCAAAFQPTIGVYAGSAVDGLTPIDTTDGGSGECDEGRSVGFTTVPGTTYRLAVDGAGEDRGHFLLHLRAAGLLPHTLSISRVGAGTVDASLAGLDCGTICSHDFEEGTAVVLSADPAPGSTFAGWSGGGCSGTGRCQLAVNADTNVTATFVPPPLGGEGGEGVGGTTPPPLVAMPPPVGSPPKKPIKCKRGFRKKTIHGKARCVKKRKQHGRRR